jgi:hypothetical protein
MIRTDRSAPSSGIQLPNTNRVPRLLVTGVASIMALLTLSLPALAGTSSTSLAHPEGCAPDRGYNYVAVTNHYVDIVPPATESPGTPLTISLTAGLGVTGTVGGQVSGDVNAIVAGAQASVSASISPTWTASVTYGAGPWTVPTGVHSGALHAGVQRKEMTWQSGSYNLGCRWIVSRSGAAKLPWQAPAF